MVIINQEPDDGTQLVIIAIGFGAALTRLLGGDAGDRPVPYTLTPRGEAALEDRR